MNQLKAFWEYGTTKPIQRVGLIVLMLGLVISILWADDQLFYHSDAGYLSLPDYLEIVIDDTPTHRDGYFFLYPYLIGSGLLMTWLYGFSVKVLCALKNWITANK